MIPPTDIRESGQMSTKSREAQRVGGSALARQMIELAENFDLSRAVKKAGF
jgi:hypothetical protein